MTRIPRVAMIATYSQLNHRQCGNFKIRHYAIAAGFYTLSVSLFMVALCSWRLWVNAEHSGALQDVYWGVQIAYFSNLGCHVFSVCFTVVLFIAIYKENAAMIVPWVVGEIAFLAMEAVATVYSNVLRDHVNREFDALCKAEAAFFIVRTILTVPALTAVIRFYSALRSGLRFSGTADVMEL